MRRSIRAGLVLDGDIIVPADGDAVTMRRRLSRDGMLIVVLDGKGGVEIDGIGLPLDEDYASFVAEAKADVVDALVKLRKGPQDDPDAIKEAARLAARRAAQRWSGKKPQTRVIALGEHQREAAVKLTSIIAIYALFWVMSAFLLLPFGVRTADEAGVEKVPGQADSAPINFRPGKFALRATLLAAVLCALFVANYFKGWITVDDINILRHTARLRTNRSAQVSRRA